ncbi:MAG TPA: TatD family hydrolase, partial [Chthoniobacteraceae bacterium]|nr:TatD family hydrolase [Chthoniobacteraceae bacterium]
QLDAHPRAGIGEIGLDRWIKGHDIADQIEVFTAQLAIAAAENRPVTIHCIQAWGTLREIIESHPLPARGFLLHSFGGPREFISAFADRGGYFSFSPYFLHARKAVKRENFRHVARDRLLIETDAPDMAPPDERNPHPLRDGEDRPLNHPANISLARDALAEVIESDACEIERRVGSNFSRIFGGD